MTALERLRTAGIRRLGRPGAFRYRTADGGPVDRSTIERIRALRIPPAWTDVHVDPAAKARLQAVGKDRAGRWQYRYHEAQTRRRERAKAERLLALLRTMPRLRQRVARDLARRGLPRERVLACVVQVLSTCFLRPGSRVYAAANRSYGVATLRRRHVQVTGDRVHFEFEGKGQKRQSCVLADRRCARIVERLLALPGHEVFKWQEGDELVDVRRRDINVYLREITGGPFTAKDLRTWGGTLVCACALAASAPEDSSNRARRRHVTAALRATAELLGNTPAVCRASYVHPAVLDHFDSGARMPAARAAADAVAAADAAALRRVEAALVHLLRSRAPRATPSPAKKRRAAAQARQPAAHGGRRIA